MPELPSRAAAITARQREPEHKRASLAAERADLARGNRLRHGVESFATRVRAVIGQLDPAQRQELLQLSSKRGAITRLNKLPGRAG